MHDRMPLAAGALAGLLVLASPVIAGVSQRPECPIGQMQPGVPFNVGRWLALCTYGGVALRAANGAVIGELGDLAVGDEVRPVLLPTALANPVVIVGPATSRDDSPGWVRPDFVESRGFRLRFQEWPHLDGEHDPESVAFLALASGRHVLPDGSVWEVGTFDVRDTERWQARSFLSAFPAPPALFLSVQTANDPDPAVVRARAVGAQGFEAALFESKESSGAHVAERVGYLAIHSPAGSGRLGVDPVLGYLMRSVEADLEYAPVASQLLRLEEDAIPDADNSHGAERIDTLLVGARVFAQDTSFREEDAVTLRRNPPEHTARIEWGVLDGVGHDWVQVPLAKRYKNPVVVVRPSSAVDADPAVMRVRNAGPTGFETRVQEWAYLDGVHDFPERAFYLVAEAGVHDLGGLLVEARRRDTAQIARSGFESVAFAESMGDVPAVFAAVMTENDPAPVTVRIHDRTPEGFGLALQEEEQAGGGHGVETLGWIAVQRGTGVTEQDRVLRVVDGQSDHTLNRIGFLRKFTFVVGGVSSYRGEDPVELKYVSLDPTGVVVLLQEENSYDDETTHVLEDVSIFAAE